VLFLPREFCDSAVFAVARCLSVRPSVSLSVSLSVAFVNCLQIVAKDIVNLLSRLGSAISFYFLFPSAVAKCKGNPVSGGDKYTGVGKFCDVRLQIRKGM